MPSNPTVKIVVPDDFPPALTGSVAEAPLKKLGQVREADGTVCLC